MTTVRKHWPRHRHPLLKRLRIEPRRSRILQGLQEAASHALQVRDLERSSAPPALRFQLLQLRFADIYFFEELDQVREGFLGLQSDCSTAFVRSAKSGGSRSGSGKQMHPTLGRHNGAVDRDGRGRWLNPLYQNHFTLPRVRWSHKRRAHVPISPSRRHLTGGTGPRSELTSCQEKGEP